jgi:hypothetical protein
MQIENTPVAEKVLGAGRSGKVILIETPERRVARKIFVGLVHYIFLGAPNPYTWNPDVIRSAYYRRKILKDLTEFWFGPRLRIADAYEVGWNKSYRAYQMDTEFVEGRPVALCQPFQSIRKNEMPDLRDNIMKPLQRRLMEAGFDGIVWQAGKGNPVALNNFLLYDDSDDVPRYVGIDVESGVPALFSPNPLILFGYYLPKSFKHGAALFDDVDTDTLAAYVQHRRAALKGKLGEERYRTLLTYIRELEVHQHRWKTLNRLHRSIGYQLQTGTISPAEAEWYHQHPLRWYGRESGRLAQKAGRKLLIDLPRKAVNKLQSLPYREWLRKSGRFIQSQRYRREVASKQVIKRISHWEDREQLSPEQAENLRQSVKRESAGDYLNDFAVHIGLKVIVKILEFVLVPLLLIFGVIDEALAIFLFFAGGPIFRTAYTGFRMVELAGEQKLLPWVALVIGLLPKVGDVAYPCQLIYSAGGKQTRVARFIVYDFFTWIGAKIPIWGGEDTQTEHFFNRCAYYLIRGVERLHR